MAVPTAVRRIGAAGVAAALVAAGIVITVSLRHHPAPPPSCSVVTDSASYTLDTDQAANAATIAAVGKRLGLPDHAVTVALATALQESRLRNLPYGDRDSLGLFQQRPSQGWGTETEIQTPSYAAAAFFRALTRVSGWQTMAITDAAQKVQISGLPLAYAQWESEARALAVALTGEQPARLTCRFVLEHSPLAPPEVTTALRNELGISSLDQSFGSAKGWTVASWLVAHARQYRITDVSFGGQQWRAKSGRWRSSTPSDHRVRFTQAEPS